MNYVQSIVNKICCIINVCGKRSKVFGSFVCVALVSVVVRFVAKMLCSIICIGTTLFVVMHDNLMEMTNKNEKTAQNGSRQMLSIYNIFCTNVCVDMCLS